MPLEHEKLNAWMASHGLDRHSLGEATGYAPETIYWFCRGMVPPQRNRKAGDAHDRRIKPWVWQRFKLACAGLDAQLKSRRDFDW